MRAWSRRVVATSLLAALAASAVGCAEPDRWQGAAFDETSFAALWAEAETGALDYQLGGPSAPEPGTTVVVRDRDAAPADVLIDVCYVNAFQTQPGERDVWLGEHPELVLRDERGEPVVDPAWPDELLLDTASDERREAIEVIVGEWIVGCAESGFEAVELDNLDSWTRAEGLDRAGNLDLARRLTAIAHDAGLAVGQKNALEAGEEGPAVGFDFVVTEECARFDECGAYGELYARHLAVEYTDALPEGESFAEVCVREDQPPLTVLRDLELTVPGDPEHVLEHC